MDKGQLEQLNPTPPSVSRLQSVLQEKFELKVEKQILLVSGGFQLGPDERLPYNGAGLNETNPIYVFTRASDKDVDEQPDIWRVSDGGLPSQLEQCIKAPTNSASLNQGASCVDAIVPIVVQTRNAIKKLMFQQGQMVQGWQAALANLAEAAADKGKRLAIARRDIAPFENNHLEWEQKFQQINDLKRDLSQVPLLPQLSQQFQGLLDPSEPNPVPSNLYEWFCLQCTLTYGGVPLSSRKSSLGTTAATRLQIAARYLHRPEILSEGAGGRRMRTTSAEQLGQDIPTPVPGVGQNHRSPAATGAPPPVIPSPSSSLSTAVASSTATGIIHSGEPTFYAGGSQPSLNSLLNYCWAEGSCSPSVSSTIGDGSGTCGAGLETANDSSLTRWDPYEVDFLSTVQRALQRLHFLRYGSRVPQEQGTEPSDMQMTYAQLQMTRMEQLLSLVASCSASTRASPRNSSDSSSDTANDPTVKQLSLETVSPNGTDLCPVVSSLHQQQQYISTDLVHQTREVLNLTYFSQHLTHVSLLTEEATQKSEEIHRVHKILNELRRHGRDLSGCVNEFQTVLYMFRQLCDLLDETMKSKLELAFALKQRQQ
ncbi:unnamed protein product [Echinostoma caproni]|uniref:Ubiquitin-like domain-containing protein n=1 Tax=Echinostoma caproni TaxID=27848 RepID=A0A183AHA1_9TREM|nr:unnamed protein product [Echinostoma caproni]